MKERKEKEGESSESEEGDAAIKTIKLSGDTNRIKIAKEISELAHVPAFEGYFESMLEEFKEIHSNEINEYRKLKESLKDKSGEIIEDGDSRSKSYFFELNRFKDSESESGDQWELGDFKLNVDGQVVNMIFSELIANIDQYEVAPNKIQNKPVYLEPLDKWFQIYFIKNRDNRVSGFVKIIEENFVKRENSTMLTVNTKSSMSLQKERAVLFMDENPTFCENISFYAEIIRKANGHSAFKL
jgi:hypothetical protein